MSKSFVQSEQLRRCLPKRASRAKSSNDLVNVASFIATPGDNYPFKALLKFGGETYECGAMSEAEGKSFITETFDVIEAISKPRYS